MVGYGRNVHQTMTLHEDWCENKPRQVKFEDISVIMVDMKLLNILAN